MAWDDKIVALPTSFTDMLDAPQTSDEVALRGGQPIVIPSNGVIDLIMAAREPSSTVPETVQVWVNGIKYSEVTDMAQLTGNTFFVNYAASRVRFPLSEVGKQITKLEYQNWGTQNRAKHIIDAYEAIKAIRSVGLDLFNALAANSKLQIVLEATTLDLLKANYPANQYPGTIAYAAGNLYYSNGVNWIKLEDITTADPVPQVVQITPAANAVNVDKASAVSIKFNQNMNGDDILANLSVKNKNNVALLGSFSFKDKNGQVVNSSSTKIREVIFDPAEIANPTTAATASGVADAASTLPAGTYYATYVWKNAAGVTLPCTTRATVTTTTGQKICVTVPTFPTNVTAADIYIGTTSGAETKQGTINTSGGTYEQTTALSDGAALPTENTTALAITTSPFYVELLPCENILGTIMVATFTSSFSCAADMLPTAATITVTNIGGDRCDVNLTAQGSDYEGAVVYDIYLRNVSQGGSFTLVAGQSGLTAAQFPRTITGLSTSTQYEITVKTRDNAGQTVDSNIVAFTTSGVIDAIPPAPDAALINITNISTNGYTVQLATTNQPTDPDNPTATITFDVAEDTTGNIVATGITSAQMNAGYAVTSANTAGTNVNIYVRAVSSTSGPGSWSAAKVITIPTNQAPSGHAINVTNVTTNGFTVSLTTPATDPEGDTITYDIKLDGTTVTGHTGLTVAQFPRNVLTSLTAGSNHSVVVTAKDATGSTDSSAANFTVPTGPVDVYNETFTAADNSAPDTTKWTVYSFITGGTRVSGSYCKILTNKLQMANAQTGTDTISGYELQGKIAINMATANTITVQVDADLHNVVTGENPYIALAPVVATGGVNQTFSLNDIIRLVTDLSSPVAYLQRKVGGIQTNSSTFSLTAGTDMRTYELKLTRNGSNWDISAKVGTTTIATMTGVSLNWDKVYPILNMSTNNVAGSTLKYKNFDNVKVTVE